MPLEGLLDYPPVPVPVAAPGVVGLADRVAQLEAMLRVSPPSQQAAILAMDPTLVTALTPSGLQVGNVAISAVDAAKVSSGDLAAARMQTNVISAWNGAGTGANAAVLTTGDVAQARMQTNAMAALNAGGGNVDAARIQTNLPSAFNGTTGFSFTALTTGNLQHPGAGTLAFYGGTLRSQQTGPGATTTNNVTAGGTDNTIADWDDTAAYLTVAPTIRNNQYQTARILKFLVDALRSGGYNLVT